jgi:AcrR family transcriptional regulator
VCPSAESLTSLFPENDLAFNGPAGVRWIPPQREDVSVPAVPTTPKGTRTVKQIIAAARRVFARDGYVSARMGDVAAEANLSMGGLYRYFDNKEALFEALIEGIHEELYAASRPVTADFATQPYAALLEANYGYLAHYRANRDVMRVLIEAAAVDRRFRDYWWRMRSRHTERFLNALSQAHDLTTIGGTDAAVAADAMACMVEQAAYVWYAQEDLHGNDVPLTVAAQVTTRSWYRLFFAGERLDGEPTTTQAEAVVAKAAAATATPEASSPSRPRNRSPRRQQSSRSAARRRHSSPPR